MTTILSKQDVVKMRKEVEKTKSFPSRKWWDAKRIVKTLEKFYDELPCDGCFDPSCGQKKNKAAITVKVEGLGILRKAIENEKNGKEEEAK